MFLPLTFTYHMLVIAGVLAAGGPGGPPQWRCGGMLLSCGCRECDDRDATCGKTQPLSNCPRTNCAVCTSCVRAVYAVMEVVYSHRHPSPGGAAHGAHGAGGARNGEMVPLSEGSRLLSGEEEGYEHGFKSISLGSMRRG